MAIDVLALAGVGLVFPIGADVVEPLVLPVDGRGDRHPRGRREGEGEVRHLGVRPIAVLLDRRMGDLGIEVLTIDIAALMLSPIGDPEAILSVTIGPPTAAPS